ncbi:hypothetical protein BZA05DRAFT_337173 [Tricharina praecox]|uniref:uncharacterized protein n=1 Tax=Tricharina praecox TaxID=43433 RepID=UPI00221EBDD4|nr:uncharacterized protein BZA05DRAFT_337173 [Tricharina praecox]KAI5852334.1 hypothetical protein BZA05DRAFT_337173 [Tricharina praecox]
MNLYSGAVPAALTHDSQLPTLREFDVLLNDYVMSLSEKKRDKALIGQVRYNNISAVLRDPKCTTIESAQFRFWAKKMFVLDFQEDENGRTSQVVMHENKPVAIREQLFGILTTAHIQCQHGGRDKTSSQVRQFYSWVPKELIARFVRGCPSCMARRSPQSIRRTSPPRRSPLRRTPPRVVPHADTPLDYHNSPPPQQQQQQQQIQPSAQTVVVVGGSPPLHHQVPAHVPQQHAPQQEYHHFQNMPSQNQHSSQPFAAQWA